MKDWVKINRAIDNKYLTSERENIIRMQKNGMYPNSYDFPLTLQFELTTRCNVFCKHCYNASGGVRKENDRMTPEKWIEFSDYLVKKGGIFQCVISGGEPLLLGDDLFRIMDILHDDGTCFLLITNGYLLDKEKVEKLSKYRYKWLQVSIDGSNEKYHDGFRQMNGSWSRAVRGAFEVTKAGIPLTIAHSVTPQNLGDIDGMCSLAYSLGAGAIILGEVNPSGRSAYSNELLLNYEEKNLLYDKIENNRVKYQGRLDIQRSSTVKNQLLKYQNTPNSGAIIRPNGDVRLDCMAPFILGNILDRDFEKLWKEKAKDCWYNEKVCEYINAFDDLSDINELQKNYVDSDILL